MADDLTLGELARSLKRIEDEQRALARSLADSNRAMVPAKLHEALQTALTEHIRVAGIDHDRLERTLGEQRRALDKVREALEKEVEQARAENATQIAALKKEREASGMNAWQRFGIASAAVLGLLAVFVAFYVGVHK